MGLDPHSLPSSIDDIRRFIEARTTPDGEFETKQERLGWIQYTLERLGYEYLSREEKGLIRQYLMVVTGYSRAQIARHITNYTQHSPSPQPSQSETLTSTENTPAQTPMRIPTTRILVAGILSLLILSIAGAKLHDQPALLFHDTNGEKTTLDANTNSSRSLPFLRDFSISTVGGTQYFSMSKPYALGDFPSTVGATVQIQSTVATIIPSPEGTSTIQPLFTQEERLTRIDENQLMYEEKRSTDLVENSWMRRLKRIFASRDREKKAPNPTSITEKITPSAIVYSAPTILSSPPSSPDTYRLFAALGRGQDGQILMIENGQPIWKYLPPPIIRVHRSAGEESGLGRLPTESREEEEPRRYGGGGGGTTPTTDGQLETHDHQTDNGGGTLDITKATKGILTYDRGGTGFGSYSTGDLLVGTAAGKLAQLTIGTAGQVLTISNGTAVWADASGGVNFAQSSSYFVDDTGDTMTGALVINVR